MTKILISEKIALALVALPPVVPTACKVPHVVFGMHPRATSQHWNELAGSSRPRP
ncbi:unnamed protein product [Symbiodinium sp. CCMP2456]|nr:unnamed protein product [Symbiodinium sp. CCMP2456]